MKYIHTYILYVVVFKRIASNRHETKMLFLKSEKQYQNIYIFYTIQNSTN